MKATALTILPLFMILTLLSGCNTGSLLAPAGPAPALYTLAAPDQNGAPGARVDWQLLVEAPIVTLDLNTARIAVAPSAQRVDYYADVAWADRAPVLIQNMIIESFDRSGRIAGVDRQHGGLRADFLLETDLRDFQVEAQQSPPSAHVRITAKLVRMRDRSIVGSRTFENAAPVGDGGFPAPVTAFDAALRQILPDLVTWTLAEGGRAR